MWISLIFLVVLIAIVLVQAPHGLFSNLIMTVLTLCCAAFAFGTYEWLATQHLAGLWRPDLAHPISLAVLFGVPMLVLRLIFDKLIKRSALLPALVDKIGGAVCSLITAMVIVGVAAIAVQMIPVGTSLIGFSRFDVAIKEDAESPPNLDAPERGLWLAPDGFAAGAAAVLSNGVFSGRVPFAKHHPNPVQAVGWVNTGKLEISRYAPPNSISVDSTMPLEVVFRFVPGNERKNEPDRYEPMPPKAGHELHVVRVKLKPQARDTHKSHIFSLRQFRLVGTVGDDVVQFFPIATQQADEDQAVNRYVSVKRRGAEDWPAVDEPMAPRSDNGNQVDVVFEVPSGFTPQFIEYKRTARARVKFSSGKPESKGADAAAESAGEVETASAAPTSEPARSAPSTRRKRRTRSTSTDAGGSTSGSRGGRTRAFSAVPEQYFFGNKLPFELRSYRGMNNAEVSRSALVGGHLVADAEQPEQGDDPPVSSLQVPQGKRLLHLNVGRLRARSGLGRILSQSVTALQNYIVTDSNGKQYKVVGKYALAVVDEKDVFEVQYFPEQAGTIGGVGKFNRIDEKELTKDDAVVFLFLVDPGARIVRFTTGGSASRAEDLTSHNLVAPK